MAPSQFTAFADGIPFPEGPVFDSHGSMFVCARRDGYLVRVGADGTVERFVEIDGKPNGLAIDGADLLIVADSSRGRVLTVDSQSAQATLIPTVCGNHRLIGPNDLCFGPSGTLYFTDPGMSLDEDVGAVYRCEPDGSGLERIATDMCFPNGLAISADERMLYVAESSSSRLMAIDLARPGTAPEVTLELGEDAVPDGMAWLDDERLIIAYHGAGVMAVVHTGQRSQRRIPLAEKATPTNVVIRDGRCYVTDDVQRGVLVCDVNSL